MYQCGTEKAKRREAAGRGIIMAEYLVRYETRLLEDVEGAIEVEAAGKSGAMFAAQAEIHPEARSDEPHFYFEPLSIRPLDQPGRYEVRFVSKVERPASGEVRVTADDPDKAAARARFVVHPELIPPRHFRAVSVREADPAPPDRS